MSLIRTALIKLAVLAGLSLGGGLGSAWYMIEAGSPLSTRTFGPWVTWPAAGHPGADPYTRAHVARNGLLPLSPTLELTFLAKSDSSGGQLTSACDYAIVMDEIDAAWWNLAVFDGRGGLIANTAERYAFTNSTAMREANGRIVITLGRDARPGNWLPSGRGGRVVLVLTVRDAAWAAAIHERSAPKTLPKVTQMQCR